MKSDSLITCFQTKVELVQTDFRGDDVSADKGRKEPKARIGGRKIADFRILK